MLLGKLSMPKTASTVKEMIIKCYWQSCLCQKQLPRYKNDNKMLLAKLSMPKTASTVKKDNKMLPAKLSMPKTASTVQKG
jgi:hypothetical protein